MMDWLRFSLLFDIYAEYYGQCLDKSVTRKGKSVSVELEGLAT